MGEFKSQRVFNKEPASKENPCMGDAQCARAYQSDFRREKCWWSSLSEDTEKRGLPPVHGTETISQILVSLGLG